jgi:hypothetical protein
MLVIVGVEHVIENRADDPGKGGLLYFDDTMLMALLLSIPFFSGFVYQLLFLLP